LLTLEQRRFLFDVTFLFKALNGYMDVDFLQFWDFKEIFTISLSGSVHFYW